MQNATVMWSESFHSGYKGIPERLKQGVSEREVPKVMRITKFWWRIQKVRNAKTWNTIHEKLQGMKSMQEEKKM